MRAQYRLHLLSLLLCAVFIGVDLLNITCKGQTVANPILWQVFIEQAKIKQRAGDFDGAENDYQLAVKQGSSLNNAEREAFDSMCKQYLLQNQNSLEQRLSAQNQEKEPWPDQIGQTLKQLATNELNLKRLDIAEEHAKTAFTILEKEHGKESKQASEILNLLAAIYQQENKPDLATNTLREKEDRDASRAACAAQDTDFGRYIHIIHKAIRSNWNPALVPASSRIVAVMKVYSDGSINDIRLKLKSNSKKADLAAIKAILLSSPLPPLPNPCYELVPVVFTFDWQVQPLANQTKPKIKPSKWGWLWEL